LETEAEEDHFLAQTAAKILTGFEIVQALAGAAGENLSPSQIKNALLNLDTLPAEVKARIAKDLSKAAEVALRDIIKKDYHGILALKAKEFIDLGLAVYGYGGQVMAAFGPQKP
jgi:hypothetical protein